MEVPSNASKADRCACEIVPYNADDLIAVNAARELLAILMMTGIDRRDLRWSIDWVRQDLDDIGLVYLELECSDNGMDFSRRHPHALVVEAIEILQLKGRWTEVAQ